MRATFRIPARGLEDCRTIGSGFLIDGRWDPAEDSSGFFGEPYRLVVVAAFQPIAIIFHSATAPPSHPARSPSPPSRPKGLGRNREGLLARGDRRDRSGLPRTLDLDEAFQELFRVRIAGRAPTQRVPRGLLVRQDAILHGGQAMRPKEGPHHRDIKLGRLRPPAIGPEEGGPIRALGASA